MEDTHVSLYGLLLDYLVLIHVIRSDLIQFVLWGRKELESIIEEIQGMGKSAGSGQRKQIKPISAISFKQKDYFLNK